MRWELTEAERAALLASCEQSNVPEQVTDEAIVDALAQLMRPDD